MAGITLEEMESREGFMRGKKPEKVTLLPDPPRAKRHLPIISTDDHLVEPPGMFDGRLPAKLADRAPRVVENPSGGSGAGGSGGTGGTSPATGGSTSAGGTVTRRADRTSRAPNSVATRWWVIARWAARS